MKRQGEGSRPVIQPEYLCKIEKVEKYACYMKGVFDRSFIKKIMGGLVWID